MAKLLVTGGAGFIGSNFVHYWNKHHPQDHVRVLDSFTRGSDPRNLQGARYDQYTGDICDESVVSQVMRDINVVVHFAAETHVDNSIKEPELTFRSNLVGTRVLLLAARNHDMSRFHYISTDEVFGQALGGRRFVEEDKHHPGNPYSASKSGSEALVLGYANTYKIPVTISNCCNNFGPRQFEEKLVPRTIRFALDGNAMEVYGQGQQIREWLHVDDHSSAVERILERGVLGETYLIGSGVEMRNRDLVEHIYTAMGLEPRVQEIADRPGHDFRYAIDSTKIRTQLGWKPAHDFTTALQETVAWYKERWKQ